MASFEDLVAILIKQKEDRHTTWTVVWKGVLMVVLILSIALLYESERVYNVINDIDRESDNESPKSLFVSEFSTILNRIKLYKKEIGIDILKQYENKLVLYLRDSPIMFDANSSDEPYHFVNSDVDDKNANDHPVKNMNSTANLSYKINESPVKSITQSKVLSSKELTIPLSKIDKLKPPYKVLMIGDSMMGGYVGIALEKKLMKIPGCKVARKGIVSSGMIYWNKKINHYVKRFKPNIIIIMIGTNDSYNKKYDERTLKLMKIIKKNRLLGFWIGLPITERKRLNSNVLKINYTHKKMSKSFTNIHYINTWTLFKKQQRFIKNRRGKLVRIRARDGVHLGSVASKRVSKYVLKTMSNHIVLKQ